jgi:hypothetical protein
MALMVEHWFRQQNGTANLARKAKPKSPSPASLSIEPPIAGLVRASRLQPFVAARFLCYELCLSVNKTLTKQASPRQF